MMRSDPGPEEAVDCSATTEKAEGSAAVELTEAAVQGTAEDVAMTRSNHSLHFAPCPSLRAFFGGARRGAVAAIR
jgi:hypothetical protein